VTKRLFKNMGNLWKFSKQREVSDRPVDREKTFKLFPLNLHQKSTLAVILILSSLIGILYTISSNILLRGYAKIEKQDSIEHTERVAEAYIQYLEKLKASNLPWSVWDDTVEFIEHPNSKYIEDNYSSDIYAKNNLSVIAMLNLSGEMIYGGSYDRQQNKIVSLPQSLKDYIKSNPSILKHSNLQDCNRGLILLPENPLLFTSCPILNSQAKAPSHGTLIFGTYLDRFAIEELSKTTRSKLKFYRLDRSLPNNNLPNLVATIDPRSLISIQLQNDRSLSAYKLLKDFSDNPATLLEINLPRDVYQQGQRSLNYLINSLIIVGLIFGVTTLILVNKLIQFWQKQQEFQARYRTIISQASDGIAIVDAISKRFLEVNPAFERLLGYDASEILNLSIYDIIVQEKETIDRTFQYKSDGDVYFTNEYQYLCKGEKLIDVEVSANLMDYDRKKVFSTIVRDISERKQVQLALIASEQRLIWEASHDRLTELLNREEFKKLVEDAIEKTKVLQHSSVLFHLALDNFSIINNTCNPDAGDECLRQIAALWKSQLRHPEKLSRLEGDEFGLIIENCSLDLAVIFAERLRLSIENFQFIWQQKIFTLTVSIGLVVIDAENSNLTSILSAADLACYSAKQKGGNCLLVYNQYDFKVK
jgi:diguanylate cyclase (GGDEF)-like protein/PAS domain S-box-containing protein